MSTCRLCKDFSGKMVKYSTRHYAHPECALEKWGASFFERLTPWQAGQFPITVADKFGVMDALERRYHS